MSLLKYHVKNGLTFRELKILSDWQGLFAPRLMSRATLARHICLLPSQARPRGPELDGAIREGFFGNIDIDACMRSCEEDLLLCALEKTQGSINIQRIPLSYPDIALKSVEGI